PCREISDTEALYRAIRVVVEFARNAGYVSRIGTGNRVENQHRILDVARHRTEFVERPAQRHRAGAGKASEGGPQPRYSAWPARTDDASTLIAADRTPDQSGRCCSSWTRARSRGAFLEQPRIHRLAAKPNIVQREGAHTKLGDEHGSSVMEALHDGSINVGDATLEWLGAVSGWNVCGVDQILRTPRNAV